MNEKTIAAYCRVASKDETAIQWQIQRINSFAEAHKLENIKHYTDNGAAGTTQDRKAFKSLLNDMESGLIDTVIAVSVSRFARSSEIAAAFENHAERNGVKIVTLDGSYEQWAASRLQYLAPTLKS